MIKYPRVSFHTLGCKLNYSETSSIARQFEEKGFKRVDLDKNPDVVVINTCSVTENADKEARYIIRKTLRKSPGAFIVVTGCAAQLKPDLFSNIPGVDVVLGSREKFQIFDLIDDFRLLFTPKSPEGDFNSPPSGLSRLTRGGRGVNNDFHKNGHSKIFTTPFEELTRFDSSFSFGDRTRSFLKVQDGCDYFCSFCTIPLARGKSRSDTIENVVKQAKEIAAKGIKEVVLTGVNVGEFEPPFDPPQGGKKKSFFHLISELDEVSGVERYRISSIEPNLLSDEIIEFVAKSKRFVPHFHIPLQSGSDKILKLMRRRYIKELFAERIKKIKELVPHCCIGADVITGFPGETENDFLETYRFLNELDISYLHVFTYSERKNTAAARMKNKVPLEERQRRTKMLINLSVRKRRHFYEQHLGTERPVLFEGENKNGFITGFTDNYMHFKAPFNKNLINQICRVRLTGINNDGSVS